jgi:hypothetical protein
MITRRRILASTGGMAALAEQSLPPRRGLISPLKQGIEQCKSHGMTITFDGAGAGAPSRSVAISMVSSLPSIGARPTYSTRTRAMPR